ncbi:MAG TPA: peptidoglycan endopeptidase [Allosphingosinicella sp.]
MTEMTRAQIVARARKLIGVRFRPQGRDPQHGLDCIGVAMMAMRVPKHKVRNDYIVPSSATAEEMNRDIAALGFIRISPAVATAGDMLLVRPGPAALHLVILTGDGYLHADMRRRRTVEVPGAVPWPTVSAWRHAADAAEDPLASELVGPSKALH